MKSIPRDIHQNIHGNGPTPYSAFGRWWHGTPEWAKVAQASPVSGGLADSINDEDAVVQIEFPALLVSSKKGRSS